ncbi:MAG: hypothetical protein FWF10_09880 [Clostridiales bacterium]|nr:hypothetical protein [Clostridiales bacterium]
MKTMKHDKKYKLTSKHKPGVRKSGFLVFLSFVLAFLLLGGAVVAFIFWGIPLMERAIALPVPRGCAPTPPETPAPNDTDAPLHDAAAHPLYFVDLSHAQMEWVVSDKVYFGDIAVCRDAKGKDILVAAVGSRSLGDGSPRMDSVLLRDPNTGTETRLTPPLAYASLRHPLLLADDMLVYLDMQTGGGGRIVAYHIKTETVTALKTVHMGVPKLSGAGHYIAWTERTGTSRYKLYLCDVRTGESVTVATAETTRFGAFAPFLTERHLFYVSGLGEPLALDLGSGQTRALPVPGVVTAVQSNGLQIAVLRGGNEEGAELWLIDSKGDAFRVAAQCSGFAICEKFLAYNVRGRNYVYFFSDAYTFDITREQDRSLLLAGGGMSLVWQNVRWRERDIVEYMVIED